MYIKSIEGSIGDDNGEAGYLFWNIMSFVSVNLCNEMSWNVIIECVDSKDVIERKR